MASDLWIMTPCNRLFFCVFAGFLSLLAAAGILLRKKSERTKARVVILSCAATLIGFIVYKYFLSLDESFNAITADMGGFNWWGELPLQLCNINMILIPIAVYRKSRPLLCFGFFVGPLGAMVALLMPANGFAGYSLLLPRMLGFYATHFMVLIEGLSLVVFGLFRPRLRDIPRAILMVIVTALGVFCINMLLRWSGLHPKANYFFSVETERNPLLEVFYRWIPLPFLYLAPGIVILGGYMLAITVPFALADRRAGDG